jgi:hypothetical protein
MVDEPLPIAGNGVGVWHGNDAQLGLRPRFHGVLRNVAGHGVRIVAAPFQSSAGQVLSGSGRSPDWLKFKNPAAPAVT